MDLKSQRVEPQKCFTIMKSESVPHVEILRHYSKSLKQTNKQKQGNTFFGYFK